MSAKVSTASSASAGAGIVGAKPAAATGQAPGSASPDGTSAAAASRGSRDSGSGASPHFSSAMTHAAHAGDSAAGTHVDDSARADSDAVAEGGDGSNTGAGADAGVRGSAAADVTSRANSAAIASAQDLCANASPALSQNAANLKTSVLGQAGNVRGGSESGDDDASRVTTDPVALAMLLVASGMQMGNAAAATVSGSADAPANAGDGRAADMAVSGATADITAGLSATGPASARDAAHSILDASSSSMTAGAGLPDAPASLLSKTANPDVQTTPTSTMTQSGGLPELVRSFGATSVQTPVVEATISVPVSNGNWPHAIGVQVLLLVNSDVQSATLRLSPEHLGPVEVQIDVRDSQVNVNFSAAHAETRAALEQTVPRLREIFASGGLTLGQTNVQADPRPASQSSANALRAAFAHAQTVEPVVIAAAHTLGLVDEYV